MRRLAAVMLVSLLLAVPTSSYAQVPFAFFKATLNLTVQFPGTDKNGNPAVSARKLSSNDILNLALGRPLTTKPDKNTEVLALAADGGSPGADSRLIVYNPSTNSVTTTVWTQSSVTLIFNGVEESSAVGVANVNVQATTLGDPTHNGLAASVLFAGGSGKGTGSGISGSATSLNGSLTFTVTDGNAAPVTIPGIVTAGKFKAGGKSLGSKFL
ncbi:MAG TPA: hypothetical protein VGK30_11395 [Candidatus Binatia bacterium]|jgi:hypothetical protein